jgi:hypothetical protein
MKRISFLLIPYIAAVTMISALPSYSDEYNISGQGQSSGRKDECLLVAKNCPEKADSIQQQIDKLQTEINRGTDVYTPDELNILNNKLDDAKKSLINQMDQMDRI